MPTKSKKKLNPTRVLAHLEGLLGINQDLRRQIDSMEGQLRGAQAECHRLLSVRDEAVAAARANGDRAVEFANQRDRHEAEIRALKAQLRAADETAGKALADAKRARDSQGVVWLVRFTSPSALPYVSFVAATKDDALLKVSRIYLKTKVLDQGARVQVFNNDAEGAFAGEYIIQQAKIVSPG